MHTMRSTIKADDGNTQLLVHFNSDWSGHVEIVLRRPGLAVPERDSIVVPGNLILQVVSEAIRRALVDMGR